MKGNFNNIIISSIQKIVDEAISKAPFTKIRSGRILAKVGNKYTILMDGREYSNVDCYGSADLTVGVIVKVIIPENNPSQMFILPPPGVYIVEP